MSERSAIQVQHVYKDFILPHHKANSVKSAFTGLFKSHDRGSEVQHALRDISLDIKEGEFFGIVGRNGSGKSTLLKILAGIYQPTKGRVSINGRLVPFIELGVGFNPELTGRENVFLNGAMLGFSRKEIQAMYQDIVDFSELERFMDQKLKNYSSGMQVRLAFAMATRSDAEVLLVDEVLAVGDADFQRKCFEYFKLLKKNKKTVVFVSHDMSAVREYCDRAVMIEKSRIVCAGTADDVATEYVKLFNEPAQSGRVDRSLVDKKQRWGDGGVAFRSIDAIVDGKNLVLKIDAQASARSEGPVFGYLIRDAAGNDLIGSNTKVKNHSVGTVEPGRHIHLTWEIPNVFNDGIFYVTVAISHNDGITQHDWWENATSFRVFREDKTPYAFNPESNVKITVI